MSKDEWRRPRKAKNRRAKGHRGEEELIKVPQSEKDVFMKYGQKLYEYDPDDLDDEYDDR